MQLTRFPQVNVQLNLTWITAASVLCDWTLATLPIVFMWNIQMRLRLKFGICALMGLGYL